MKRFAIVVGHNSEKQGAVRGDSGETEFVWNSDLAKLIEHEARDYADLEVRTFYRQAGLGYRGEIRRVYEETDRWGANVTVELHFNSHADPSATGTETLTSGTPASMALAVAVNREVVAALGLRDRGVKTRASDDRGGASLMSGRAPAILIEPFFGSSPKGQKATDTTHEKEALAEAIMRGVASSLDAMPRTEAQMANSRTLKATKRQRQKIWTGVGGSLVSIAGSAASTLGLSQGDTALDAVSLGTRLAEYLPWLGVIAPVGLILLLFFMNSDANDIEEARWDDHDNGLR